MSKTINEIQMPVLIEDLGMLYPTEKSKRKIRYGLYKCYCGKEFAAQSDNIKSGHTKSCGCYSKEMALKANTTHGCTRHPLYSTWNGIVSRTTNPNSTGFKEYGGRGISICERWRDIKNFIDDMYPTYKEGLTLDRIDANGNYEPSNCRWTTKTVQSRNTRTIRSTNKSGYRGVDIIYNRFRSRIVVNNKAIHLGVYDNPRYAAIAYDTFVIVYGLEHTCNFPKGVFK